MWSRPLSSAPPSTKGSTQKEGEGGEGGGAKIAWLGAEDGGWGRRGAAAAQLH